MRQLWPPRRPSGQSWRKPSVHGCFQDLSMDVCWWFFRTALESTQWITFRSHSLHLLGSREQWVVISGLLYPYWLSIFSLSSFCLQEYMVLSKASQLLSRSSSWSTDLGVGPSCSWAQSCAPSQCTTSQHSLPSQIPSIHPKTPARQPTLLLPLSTSSEQAMFVHIHTVALFYANIS